MASLLADPSVQRSLLNSVKSTVKSLYGKSGPNQSKSQKKKKNQNGGKKGEVNVLASAPANIGVMTRSIPFRFGGSVDPNFGPILRISGHHIVCQITSDATSHANFGNVGTSSSSYTYIVIDPSGVGGTTGSVPLTPSGCPLDRFARAFAKFRFRKLRFKYMPVVNTQTAGSIGLGFSQDPAVIDNTTNYTESVLSQLNQFVTGPVWEPWYFDIKGLGSEWKFNFAFTNSTTDYAELRQCSQGALLANFADANLTAAGFFGRLELDYEVEFCDFGPFSGTSSGGLQKSIFDKRVKLADEEKVRDDEDDLSSSSSAPPSSPSVPLSGGALSSSSSTSSRIPKLVTRK